MKSQLEEFYYTNKKFLEYALYLIREQNYTEKEISKKTGGKRKLNIPSKDIKIAQYKFYQVLSDIYEPPKCVYSFIKKDNAKEVKNIISNASKHTKRRFLYNFDIENFFDSINFGRVRGLFLSKPYKLDKYLATRFAQLVTYQNKLPQGSSTSPIISNMICLRMDNEFMRLSKELGCTYTRYADDLTFSTRNKHFSHLELFNRVNEIILKNGFKINKKKTRIQTHNQKQIVTGLKVNSKVNVDRKYIRNLRSMLYAWQKDGIKTATKTHFSKYNMQQEKYLSKNPEDSFKNIIMGKIDFLGEVKGINNQTYRHLKYLYYLINEDFKLTHNTAMYERLNLNDFTKNKLIDIFTPKYDSVLVVVEGKTDAIYLKAALHHFQGKKLFENLKLRFCYMDGCGEVMNLFRFLYYSLNKIEDINIRNCLFPYIPNDAKICFILDSDESGIIKFLNKNRDRKNLLVIEEYKRIYIEQLFKTNEVISIINKKHEKIDITKLKDSDTIKQFNEYFSSGENKLPKIKSISNFIVHKDLYIKKSDLANEIFKNKSIDFSEFESILGFIENVKKQEHSLHRKKCKNSLS